jgi:hypothetical protein
MDPGLKGCQYLLGTLPSWINYTEREKMEVRQTAATALVLLLGHTSPGFVLIVSKQQFTPHTSRCLFWGPNGIQ